MISSKRRTTSSRIFRARYPRNRRSNRYVSTHFPRLKALSIIRMMGSLWDHQRTQSSAINSTLASRARRPSWRSKTRAHRTRSRLNRRSSQIALRNPRGAISPSTIASSRQRRTSGCWSALTSGLRLSGMRSLVLRSFRLSSTLKTSQKTHIKIWTSQKCRRHRVTPWQWLPIRL